MSQPTRALASYNFADSTAFPNTAQLATDGFVHGGTSSTFAITAGTGLVESVSQAGVYQTDRLAYPQTSIQDGRLVHLYPPLGTNGQANSTLRLQPNGDGYVTILHSPNSTTASLYLFSLIGGKTTQLGVANFSNFDGTKTFKIDFAAVGINPTNLSTTYTDSAGNTLTATATDSTAEFQATGGAAFAANLPNSSVTITSATIYSGDPAPPSIGPITITSTGGMDSISYPAPTAGSGTVGGVTLYVGTTAGGESSTIAATNPGTSAGVFSYPQGSNYYVVRAYDTSSPAMYSAPSNEVQGAAPASGSGTFSATQINQITTVVSNQLSLFLGRYFPDGFLQQLQAATGLANLNLDAKISSRVPIAGVIEVDVASIGGSIPAAQGLRDQTLTSSTSTLQAVEQIVIAALTSPAATLGTVDPTSIAGSVATAAKGGGSSSITTNLSAIVNAILVSDPILDLLADRVGYFSVVAYPGYTTYFTQGGTPRYRFLTATGRTSVQIYRQGQWINPPLDQS